MRKTPSIVAQVYGAALKFGGIVNAMNPYSRKVLKEVTSKNTTEADLQAMRAAQAKRDRKAARNLSRSAS